MAACKHCITCAALEPIQSVTAGIITRRLVYPAASCLCLGAVHMRQCTNAWRELSRHVLAASRRRSGTGRDPRDPALDDLEEEEQEGDEDTPHVAKGEEPKGKADELVKEADAVAVT